MGIHLLTFAGDYQGQKYITAATNLQNWANEFQLFDSITIITKETLFQNEDFSTKHLDFIYSHRRGFGYWIWKPYIIYKKLQELEDNDILCYLDSCCFLNIEGKTKFLEYIELVQKNPDGNLFFEYSQKISDWCKMDTIEALDAKNIMNEREVVPGVIFTTVNSKNIEFFKNEYDIACNYHLIDDSPSVLQNTATFREHRHDQSLFSILTRKYLPLSISKSPNGNELYFYQKEEQGKKFPIWTQANNY